MQYILKERVLSYKKCIKSLRYYAAPVSGFRANMEGPGAQAQAGFSQGSLMLYFKANTAGRGQTAAKAKGLELHVYRQDSTDQAQGRQIGGHFPCKIKLYSSK